MKKYKIGVFGSSSGDTIEKATKAAKRLGTALGKTKHTVITGACSGLPYIAASEAHANGSDVWGFSPETSLAGQKQAMPNDDVTIYSKLIYVPRSYEFAKNERVTKKYRNVTSTANCDAGIIISGRWGSLNEFTNLFDMGKVIGVLTETGGVADEIQHLAKKIRKPGKAVVIYDSSPARLVSKIVRELQKRK